MSYQSESIEAVEAHLREVAWVQARIEGATLGRQADPEAAALQAAVASLATTLGTSAPLLTTETAEPDFLSDVDRECRLVKARRHAREAAWLELNNKSKD